MAICPFAKWEPLSRTSPIMLATCVVVHSNAGTSGDLHGWWESNPDGLMSHFQIGIDGTIWQYVDTDHQAYANVEANAFGISIETANNPGHGAQPAFDSDRWVGAQLASLIRLLEWCCSTHGIAPKWCIDAKHGIGAHDEFPQWTTPGHQCPGFTRAGQLRTEIVPRLLAPSAPTPEDLDMEPAELRRHIAEVLRSEGVSGANDEAKRNGKKLDELAAAVKSVTVYAAGTFDRVAGHVRAVLDGTAGKRK